MRRAGSVLPTHQRTKFESTATLCILFVIGDLFAIAAIVYLLSGDKRVLMIQEYDTFRRNSPIATTTMRNSGTRPFSTSFGIPPFPFE